MTVSSTSRPPRRSHPSTSRRSRRTPLWGALLIVSALTLVTAVPAEATWTTPVQTASGATSTGRLAVALGGVESLGATYSSSALTNTAALTVANTGTVPAPWRLSLSAAASSLAETTRVTAWPSTSARCSTPPADASSGSWAALDGPSGTLPAGASSIWCVRTSITQADRFDAAGQATTVTAELVARLGAWSSTATAAATQTVADTLTPGAPTKTAETDTSIGLSWPAPADSAGGVALRRLPRRGARRHGPFVDPQLRGHRARGAPVLRVLDPLARLVEPGPSLLARRPGSSSPTGTT